MKIMVYCKNPDTLLKNIKARLSSDDSKTWEMKSNDKNEPLYNHSPSQWSDKVLLKPSKVEKGVLIETKHWSHKTAPDEDTKGYIIGRFIEVLMVHFRKDLDVIEVY